MTEQDRDEGFSLIEVMVALFVFALLSLAVLGLLMKSMDVVGSNESRAVATNIAQRQVETMRGLNASDIPDGLITNTVDVGGTTYTVNQTGTYGSSTFGSTCGGDVAHKRVSVEVTWPSMGAIEPVRSDTVKTVALGEFDLTKGSVAVPVVSEAGTPQSGVQVTLGALTQTTGAGGCVVFAGLSPGTVTAAASRTGFVGPQGSTAPSRNVLVEAGRTVTASDIQLAAASTVRLTPTASGGAPVPATLGVTVANTALSAGNLPYPDCTSVAAGTPCVSGTPKSVGELFPFPDGYEVWAGTCTDSRPTSPPVATPPAGGSVDVALPLGRLDVTVLRRDAVSNASIAYPGAGVQVVSGCGDTHAAGSAGGSGSLSVSLPRGTWRAEVASDCVPEDGWPSTSVEPGTTVAVQIQCA